MGVGQRLLLGALCLVFLRQRAPHLLRVVDVVKVCHVETVQVYRLLLAPHLRHLPAEAYACGGVYLSCGEHPQRQTFLRLCLLLVEFLTALLVGGLCHLFRDTGHCLGRLCHRRAVYDLVEVLPCDWIAV